MGRSRHPAISVLLLTWQERGDVRDFDALVGAVRDEVERVVTRELHRHHLHDPAAVDDTVSLVLDHLRRLPGPAESERPVAAFRIGERRDDVGDPGLAFVTWLATERARDVIRSRRARDRRVAPFAQFDVSAQFLVDGATPPGTAPSSCNASADPADRDDLATRLGEALPRIDARLARVLTMLLQGRAQADIARDLGVCEGTVSRMKLRAIHQIRAALRLG
jgi:RNA polymerase sigma factor (sigma-70 family)